MDKEFVNDNYSKNEEMKKSKKVGIFGRSVVWLAVISVCVALWFGIGYSMCALLV